MKGIQYYIITEDVGCKTNLCNAEQLSKLKNQLRVFSPEKT